jgi:hypothetical protein
VEEFNNMLGNGWNGEPQAMRKRLFFEPLALFLCYLMMTPVLPAQDPVTPPAPHQTTTTPVAPDVPIAKTGNPVLDSARPGDAPAPGFPASVHPQPRALSGNCVYNGGNYIIQLICSGTSLSSGAPPSGSLISSIQQFESDSIKQWLATYAMSNTDSDVAFFYQYARSDLRIEVRAYMKMRLMDISYRLRQPDNNVTTNEQIVHDWFRDRVKARIVAMDQDAVNDKNSWLNDRCGYRPDPDVAVAFNFSYIPCIGLLTFNTAPNKDYYLAAAKKRTYTNMISSLNTNNLPTAFGGTHSAELASSFQPRAAATSTPVLSATTIQDRQDTGQAQIIQQAGATTGGVLGAAVVSAITLTLVPQTRRKIFPNSKTREFLRQKRDDKKVANDKKNPSNVDMNERESDNINDTLNKAKVEGDTDLETKAKNVIKGLKFDEVASRGVGSTRGPLGDLLIEDLFFGTLSSPAVLIDLAIAIVIAIVTIAIDEASAEKTLNDLDSLLATDSAATPDLFGMYSDATSQQRERVDDSWAEITWPDIQSTAALPTTAAPTDPVLYSYLLSQPDNITANNFAYTDWKGVQWTGVKGIGGYLVGLGTYVIPSDVLSSLPAGSSDTLEYDYLNRTIHYTDWSGDQFWAARVGNGFVVGRKFLGDTDVACPAGPSGVTELTDLSSCSVWVTDKLNVVSDLPGSFVVVGLATHPAFNVTPDATQINFNTADGTNYVPISVSGSPAPSFFADPATPLPNGVTIVPVAGGFKFQLSATGLAPGTYSVTMHAKNPAEDVTKAFTFNVSGPDLADPPSFDAAPSNPDQQGTVGLPVDIRFHVRSGYNVTFSTNITSLPPGLQFFFDSASNTVRVAGTPTAVGVSQVDLTQYFGVSYIVACDGQNRCAKSRFTFASVAAPAAQFQAGNTPVLSFQPNQYQQYTLTTTGAITPVSFPGSCLSFPLPSWLTMQDNGNGSVTFAGTAPADSGAYTVYLASVIIKTVGGPDSACDHNNLQIFRDATPDLFLSSGTVSALGGTNFNVFLPTTLAYGVGTMSTTSLLPAGMQLLPPANASSQWSLSGTPLSGTGGDYNITLNMKAIGGGATVSKPFVLKVNEGASLNLPPVIYFMAGISGQYIVKPGGYPTLGTMTVSNQGALPTGVIFSTGALFTDTPGTGTLKGTPDPSTAGTSWPLTITANNNQGHPATQVTTLHIAPPGDVTHDDVVNCSDVTAVKAAIGAKPGDAKYNFYADINGDGVIDVRDLAFVTSKLPIGTRCN